MFLCCFCYCRIVLRCIVISLFASIFNICILFSLVKKMRIYLIAIVCLGPLGTHEIHRNCGLTIWHLIHFVCLFSTCILFVCTLPATEFRNFFGLLLCYFGKMGTNVCVFQIDLFLNSLFVCSIVCLFVVFLSVFFKFKFCTLMCFVQFGWLQLNFN